MTNTHLDNMLSCIYFVHGPYANINPQSQKNKRAKEFSYVRELGLQSWSYEMNNIYCLIQLEQQVV